MFICRKRSDDLDIRAIKQWDIPQAKSLWKTCFNDKDAFIDAFFKGKYQEENALGYFEGIRLIAMLYVIPYTIRLLDADVLCYCVAGVATDPQFRRQGLSTKLIKCALEILRNRGISSVFLYPFEANFYEKIGFSTVYDMESVQIKKMDILQDLDWSIVRKADFYKDKFLFQNCYQKQMETYSGYILRNDNVWNQWAMQHQVDMWVERIDSPVGKRGYIVAGKTDGKIVVEEMAAENQLTYGYLLGALKNGMTDDDILQIKLPHDVLPKEFILTSVQTEGGCMARILDISLFFSQFCVAESWKWIIEIQDELPNNQSGVYSFEASDKRIKARKCNEAPQAVSTIGELTQIAWGGYRGESEILQSFAKCFQGKKTLIYEKY